HQEERGDEEVERGGDVELECGAQVDGDGDAQPAHVHRPQQALRGGDRRPRGSAAQPLHVALPEAAPSAASRKPCKHNTDIVLWRRATGWSGGGMDAKYWKQCRKVQERSAAGGAGIGWRLLLAHAASLRGRRGAPAVRAGDARGVAQPSVDRPRFEFRRENAGRPVLAQPARPADGGGGFDPLRRGERGSDVAADRVLVAASAGGGQPPREIPAALPPPVDGAAVVREPHGSNGAAGSRTLRAPFAPPRPFPGLFRSYCTAFTMSKIGRYMATTMPPTTTPSTTIMMGSMRESSVLTAASTSSS